MDLEARTEDEIEKLLNEVMRGSLQGSRFPGMTYEDGIRAAIDWLTGETDEYPYPER